MKWLFGVVLAVMMAVGVVSVAQAKSGSKKKGATCKALAITIKAVDVYGRTITVQRTGEKPTVYAFNDFLQVKLNGQPVTVNELRAGMKVLHMGNTAKNVHFIEATGLSSASIPTPKNPAPKPVKKK